MGKITKRRNYQRTRGKYYLYFLGQSLKTHQVQTMTKQYQLQDTVVQQYQHQYHQMENHALQQRVLKVKRLQKKSAKNNRHSKKEKKYNRLKSCIIFKHNS